MLPRVRSLLPFLLVLVVAATGCGRRRASGDDDSTTDDDANPDDDSSDDDTTGDDDTTPIGDDDTTAAPQAPVITGIAACEIILLGSPYGQFTFTLTDSDGDLWNPVNYEVRLNGGPAIRAFVSESDLGGSGQIIHRDLVGIAGLDRGSTHLWEFRVTDSGAHTGDWAGINWQIPTVDGTAPCP